jgi:hypothetical protein
MKQFILLVKVFTMAHTPAPLKLRSAADRKLPPHFSKR